MTDLWPQSVRRPCRNPLCALLEAAHLCVRGARVLPAAVRPRHASGARAAPQQLTKTATRRLCHLLISIDNESMALEEFIIDLCEESVNGALLVGPNFAFYRSPE